MPTFRIQRVDIADALVRAAIESLDDEVFPGGLTRHRGYFGAWWIARAGREVAAYAAVYAAGKTPNAGYLARCGVLPRFRGHGLQKRLIRLRIRHARAQGWDALVTDTFNDNYASANSLIACGFRLYKPEFP